MSSEPANRVVSLPVRSPTRTTAQRQRELIQELVYLERIQHYDRVSFTNERQFIEFASLHTGILRTIVNTDDEQVGALGSKQRQGLFNKGCRSLHALAEGVKRHFPPSNEGSLRFIELHDKAKAWISKSATTGDYRDGVSARRYLIQQHAKVLYDTEQTLTKRSSSAEEVFLLLTDTETTRDVSLGKRELWTVRVAAVDLKKVNGDWRAERLVYAAQAIAGMAQCLSKRLGMGGIQIWGQIVPSTFQT